MPRSPGCCWAPTPQWSTWDGRGALYRGRLDGLLTCGTAAANGQGAIAPPRGPRRITSSTGVVAAVPIYRISCFSVTVITGWSTKVDGRLSVMIPAGSSPFLRRLTCIDPSYLEVPIGSQPKPGRPDYRLLIRLTQAYIGVCASPAECGNLCARRVSADVISAWREYCDGGQQRVRGSVRAWLPATAVAAVLTVGLAAAAYFSLVRGSAGSGPAPSPSTDIHSKEAVMAAVRHYYEIEDKAGETGNIRLILAVTTGPGTPAYENLKQFFREQGVKNRNSIITRDDFSDWSVAITDTTAVVQYGIVQHGHDIDATTRQPVEADTKTTKGIYKATMKLTRQAWLMHERKLISDAAS